MKTLYFLLAAVALTGISCSKDHPDTSLIGTWEWVRSSGGFTGGTQTPASTGQARIIQFLPNGQFQSDINGNLSYDQYQIITASCIHYGGVTKQVDYAHGISETFVFLKDSLMLDEEAYDGFKSIYVRR